MEILRSFPPIIGDKPQVLILGSLPSVKSLSEQQYYAHPQNHFWPIMFALFGKPLERDYEKRVQLLKQKGIALWDVIGSCQREGSLDSNIKNETVNDFESLFKEYPEIKLVAFNGTKAHDTFRKRVGFDIADKEYLLLPSTSPANTAKFEDKLKAWQVILNYLES